jgi:hypothetical protein
VRNEVGADANIVAANRIRKGGIGGFFAKEGFEVVVDPREDSGDAPVSSGSLLDLAEEINAVEREQVIDLGEQFRVSTETPDFGSMLAHLTRDLGNANVANVASNGNGNGAAPPAQTARPGSVVTLPVDEPPVAPREHYRRVTTDPGAPATPMPARQLDPRLVALGLPPALIPALSASTDLRNALYQRLAMLPPPPQLPRTQGVVVAVIGIGTAPISLAQKVADELDIEADQIVLATPESMSELSHPEEADAFRRGCRRRNSPTVVALSIGPGRAQLGWAHRMLDRLEPTITWAVVDASCKPEDIEHRIELLGGVDVLALTGASDTISPAAILQLDIPIGRIGSKHATPAAWADLLMERLERDGIDLEAMS